jgi:hypothetical protein
MVCIYFLVIKFHKVADPIFEENQVRYRVPSLALYTYLSVDPCFLIAIKRLTP